MELVIVILVTIIAAIIGGVIWPMFGSRIHKPAAHMLRAIDNEHLIQRVLDFYIDRIEYQERIPPSFLRYYLSSPEYSVTSIDQLPQKCSINEKPVHVLLYVKVGDQIVGACKLIYICELESFFVAYYAAKPNENISSTVILSAMMDYISPYIENKHNLYYEICDDRNDGNSHVAKARLFRHYAQSRGFDVHVLVENYLQPEISAFEGEFASPIPAKLFVLTKDKANSTRFSERAVVDAIFESVYLHSFLNVDPEYKDQYAKYLKRVKTLLKLGTTQK